MPRNVSKTSENIRDFESFEKFSTFEEQLGTFFDTFGTLFRFSTLNSQDVPQAELTTEEPRPKQKATLELNAGLYLSFEVLRCFDISFKFQRESWRFMVL